MIGYKQTDEGDLMVENGDFVKGDITIDIVADIINYMPNDNKASPIFGAGFRTAIGGKADVFVLSRIKKQLKQNKIGFKKITIVENNVNVELK